MKLFCLLVLTVLGIVMFHSANAEVWIPDDEFKSYFDSKGIYAVFGAVRNTNEQPMISTVKINIQDGNKIISSSFTLPPVYPNKDMPFKFKFPQVTSNDPILEKPQLNYEPTLLDPMNVEVIYDKTLVRHTDGHMSGFIMNNGSLPVYGVKLYALIHSKDNNFIDEAESIEKIAKMDPGDKQQFTMYPDPKAASFVAYYSCFVASLNGSNPINMIIQGNNNTFNFAVDSLVYFTQQKFVDDGKTLYLHANDAWPMTTFANFMFPMNSKAENFTVTVDGGQTYALNSLDNSSRGWHVAFNVGHGDHIVLISGFNSSNTVGTSVPEFGPIAFIVLAISIVLILAVSAKTRLKSIN